MARAEEIRDESAARVHKRTPASATTLTPEQEAERVRLLMHARNQAATVDSRRRDRAADRVLMDELDDWRQMAQSLAFWLDRHVDPPNGTAGCPEHCDARRVLAKYREMQVARNV